MTIETKYNIGDEVWTIIYENGYFETAKCQITSIEFKTNNCIRYRLKLATDNTDIDADYILGEYNIKDLYIENRLFKTKEELLKNL